MQGLWKRKLRLALGNNADQLSNQYHAYYDKDSGVNNSFHT